MMILKMKMKKKKTIVKLMMKKKNFKMIKNQVVKGKALKIKKKMNI